VASVLVLDMCLLAPFCFEKNTRFVSQVTLHCVFFVSYNVTFFTFLNISYLLFCHVRYISKKYCNDVIETTVLQTELNYIVLPQCVVYILKGSKMINF